MLRALAQWTNILSWLSRDESDPMMEPDRMPLMVAGVESTPKRVPKTESVLQGAILHASGLKKAFGGRVILDDADFTLRPGEVVLLSGRNGSGKTTLLNIISGVLVPDAGSLSYSEGSTWRTYKFPLRAVGNLEPRQHFRPEFLAKRGIRRAWQSIRLFGSLSILENVAVAWPDQSGEHPGKIIAQWPKCMARERSVLSLSKALLGRLGLGERTDSYADEVSLGQAKRVGIARAAVPGLRVLLLDEALSGLDAAGIEDVLGLLASLVAERDLALVVVEHETNQGFFGDLITTHWRLADGRLNVSRVGRRSIEVPRSPRIQGTNSTQAPRWIESLTNSRPKVTEQRIGGGAVITRFRAAVADEHRGQRTPILEVRELKVKRGPRWVFGAEDGSSGALNLHLHEGDVMVLRAPNGWGKSTFAAALAGLLPVEAGSIFLDGQAMHDRPAWQRSRMGVRFLLSNETGFANLRVSESFRLANSAIPEPIRHLNSQSEFSLSGGERRRVAFGMTKPGRLGLLDEPFDGLDTQAIYQTLDRIQDGTFGSTLLLIPAVTKENWV